MSAVAKKIEKMLEQISDTELRRNWAAKRSVFKIRVLLLHPAQYLKSTGTNIKKFERGIKNGNRKFEN